MASPWMTRACSPQPGPPARTCQCASIRGRGRWRGQAIAYPRRSPCPLAAVLVNCGVAVPTASVFRALGLAPGATLDGPALPARLPADRAGLIAAIAAVPNDLEPPAVAVAPEIARVVERLADAPQARLVRMSGSGATVFALTEDCRAAAALARRVLAEAPEWWVKPTILR